MPFRIKLTLAFFFSLLALIIIVPLVVPIRALDNTVDASDLADEDSLFTQVNEIDVHYKDFNSKKGDEGEKTFVLLHGFGSNIYTWHEIVDALATRGRVIAFDRPAFGLTEKPLEWQGTNPYSLKGQVNLTLGLLDELNIDQAIFVGHSAGATVSTALAVDHPTRVEALVLIDAAIYQGGGTPAWIRPLLYTPQMNRLGPTFMRQIAQEPGQNMIQSAWYDPEKLDADTTAAYRKPLQVHDWDKALWELTKASRSPGLAPKLSEIRVPALVVSGREDMIVPLALSERLATDIPNAELTVLDTCGHVPQEECPQTFLESVENFLQTRLN